MIAETMPNGTCDLLIHYACETCRHINEEQPPRCGINPLMTVALVINNHRTCPFRNKTEEQINEYLKQLKDDSKDKI